MQHIDGQRTIAEIVGLASQANFFVNTPPAEFQVLAKFLFQLLWKLDFVAMGLNNPQHNAPSFSL